MELLFLMCVAIAAFATKAKVDSTAYANGKEPASVAKARMRHEAAGGARSATGKPKGPGALRLLLASRWANACAAAKQRGEHKAARRRAWYDETAPLKDEEWRRKKLARLDKADRLRNRWAADRGLVDLDEYRERRDQRREDEAWAENERRGSASGTGTSSSPTAPPDFPVYPPDDLGDCPNCGNRMSPLPGSFQADEGDGTASVATICRDCSLRSSHSWTLSDSEYRHCFGHSRINPAANAARNAENALTPPIAASYERCPKCHTAMTVLAHTANADEGTGAAQVDTICPGCGLQSCFDWTLTDQQYRDHFGHDFNTDPDPESGGEDVDLDALPAAGSPTPGSTDTPRRHRAEAEKGSDVYQQAAQQLIAAADQVAQYRADLAAFADTLDGKRWGTEVTGPIKDMDTQLTRIEGDYRDLAGQITHQGDQGAAAYDQAPWVPGPDAVMA